MKPYSRRAQRSLALAAILVSLPASADTQTTLGGIDHIPIVVKDLDHAAADYRAMGFTLKPGRPHENSIRNLHVKFSDATEIELITATQPIDELSREYVDWLSQGEGPLFFGLYARDRAGLMALLTSHRIAAQQQDDLIDFPAGSVFHRLFFGSRGRSPTDKPEYFRHANGAHRVRAVWVADSGDLPPLLHQLGARAGGSICSPFTSRGTRWTFGDGELDLIPGGRIAVQAVVVEVDQTAAVSRILEQRRITYRRLPCAPQSVWVPPSAAHGTWLEFRAK